MVGVGGWVGGCKRAVRERCGRLRQLQVDVNVAGLFMWLGCLFCGGVGLKNRSRLCPLEGVVERGGAQGACIGCEMA